LANTRLQLLRRWRDVAAKVAETVGSLYPQAEVYLIGGAAEGRLTALSDIDVAVVFNRELSGDERADILAELWEELEERGVPPSYPLHILVLSRNELERLYGRKERLR